MAGFTITGWARDIGRAIAVAARQPSLARAELAFGTIVATDLAVTVGVGVVAFRDGGAALVGLVSAIRLVPAAVVAPAATVLADRWPRERVLAASSALAALAAAAMSVVLASGGSPTLVYGLAVGASIAITPYRAANSALLPSLCRTSDELTASNIVRALVESVSVVIGPLLAAIFIEYGELWTVFAAAALISAGGVGLVVALPYEHAAPTAPATRLRVGRDVVEGAQVAWRDRRARLLIGLAGVQTFLRGCLGVFTVVLAIDTLDRGDSGVGVLGAALGVGSIAGSIGASRLVGTRRMAAWFGGAVAMWGIPLCVIGVGLWWSVALLMVAVIGVANAVLDVGLFTMLGRLVPDEVLARVFGIFEAVVAVTVALGSLAAAAMIDIAGIRWALILLGAVAPAAVALCARPLAALDRSLTVRQRELDVLARVPMLRALTVPAKERLARRLRSHIVAPGEVVVTEGTPGDSYYVVAEGEVEVRKGDTVVGILEAGSGFGEVALLRDVARTATVTATGAGPVELLCIDRQDFVRAITSYRSATEAADEAIAQLDR